MEQHAENASTDHLIRSSNDRGTDKPLHQPRLKRQGSKNILKVAIFKMRGRSQKSKVVPGDDGSMSMWRKLVGSMRPLHLQSSQSPTEYPDTPHTMNSTESVEEGFDSIPNSPVSPSPSNSRYASAIGLDELVRDEESRMEEVLEEDNGNGDGDEMIDAKAEEFIADFYLQMKLQRFNVTHHRYREISNRSLGL